MREINRIFVENVDYMSILWYNCGVKEDFHPLRLIGGELSKENNYMLQNRINDVNREKFRFLFNEKGYTLPELASEFGITKADVKTIRDELGLKSTRGRKAHKSEEPASAPAPEASAPSKKPEIPTGGNWVIYTDAATVGNFGKMGLGCVLFRNGNIESLGAGSPPSPGTNNMAEYLAILASLREVAQHEPESVVIKSDSQLAVNQINGEYEVKDERLQALHREVVAKAKALPCPCTFLWIPREENKLADAIASLCVQMPMAVVDTKAKTFQFWDLEDFPANGDITNLPAVHPECEKAIHQLNSGEKVKFGDFVALKTYGIDDYSRMDKEKLFSCIKDRFSEDTLTWLQLVLSSADSTYEASTLKWTARGLHPDLALKKASVDMEINAKKPRNN